MEAGAAFHQDPKAAGPQRPADHAVRDAREAGSGWVSFAGAYLLIAGTLNVIWGVTALSKQSYFHENSLVWSSLNTWGWIGIIAGVVQAITAGLLLMRWFGGAVLAIGVAIAGILVNFMSIGAYPIWSGIAIACSALVLWAVTVHGDAFADSEPGFDD